MSHVAVAVIVSVLVVSVLLLALVALVGGVIGHYMEQLGCFPDARADMKWRDLIPLDRFRHDADL